jgi:hypothetical protein
MMDRRPSRIRLPRALVALGLVTLLGACSGLAESGKTPEEIVALRAQARWDAVLADDWETAYSYVTPAYRERMPLKAYRIKYSSKVARKGVRIHKAECTAADACKATVVMRFIPPPPVVSSEAGIETAFDENWILGEDGKWYHVH